MTRQESWFESLRSPLSVKNQASIFINLILTRRPRRVKPGFFHREFNFPQFTFSPADRSLKGASVGTSRIKKAIVLSLALHIVTATSLWIMDNQNQPLPPPAITVEILEMPKPPPSPPAMIEPIQKQIVEQDPKSLNDETPQKEAYLSATNQRVEKETIARERGEFRNRDTKAKRSVVAPQLKKKQATAPQKPSLRDLMGNDPIKALQQKSEEMAHQEEPGTQAGTEASRTSDYIKNVAESGETMLNTREFKYYTYYSRIRRQLSQHWEPKVKVKLNHLFRQGRRIASDKDHVTKLLIILDNRGLLVGVQVVTESGVTALDEAATDAFRAAAPFPNPPAGMVDPDGTVKIRWDFVLES